MRRWGILVAVVLVFTALSRVAPDRPVLMAPVFGADTSNSAASPAASSSPAVQLPLYTPIPVSEGRNAVGRVRIELTDRGFIPSRFEDAINQDIVVTLVNTGTRLHNFSIDELDVDVDVAPGETTTLTVASPRRLGRYTYYSDTPEDRALGMTGTMTIFI
jgi:hypothetical protein